MKILMLRTLSGALVPLNDEERELLDKRAKAGAIVECDVIVKRNPQFMRKFFALLKVGFDLWTEHGRHNVTYHGQRVEPNFDRFRKDITILCGFYEATYNIKGELRLEPRSIAFGSMEDDEFEQLYSTAINVLLNNVLARVSIDEQTLRESVDRILAFDH